MKWATVEFATGHKLEDNGVGDYSLWCPRAGDMGLADMGMVAMMASDWVCLGCGEAIGAPVHDAPRPYSRDVG